MWPPLSYQKKRGKSAVVMLLSLLTSTTLGQTVPCRFIGGEKKDGNERKQCSSPCVSLRKWCNATPQRALHGCRRVLPLKMYHLAEFDTLVQPQNSIQKVVLKKEESNTYIDPRVPVSVILLSNNSDIILLKKKSETLDETQLSHQPQNSRLKVYVGFASQCREEFLALPVSGTLLLSMKPW